MKEFSMSFTFDIKSIKSCLLVVMKSTILQDLGEIIQIIAPKKRSLDPCGGRCPFLALRKSQITFWRHNHSQEHVPNRSVDVNFKTLVQSRWYFFYQVSKYSLCQNRPAIVLASHTFKFSYVTFNLICNQALIS